MKKSTLALVILLAIFFTSTLVLLYLNFIKPPTAATQITNTVPTIEPTAVPIIASTADWKTFNNNLFEFKYPNDWSISPSTERYISLNSPKTKKDQANPQSEIPDDIFIGKNNEIEKKYSSLEDFINDQDNFTHPNTINKITIDNQTAYQYEQGGMNNANIIVFKLGESYYQIISNVYYPSDNIDKKAIQSTINQILSTFSFNYTGDLPSELVNLVKSTASSESTKESDGVIIGQSKIVGNFASVAFNYTTGGGAIYWAAKINGTWQIVTGGQEPPKCSLLLKYSFPKEFSCTE